MMNRLQLSPNYKNGAFRNESPTPMMVEGISRWGLLKEYFRNNKATKPGQPIPSVQTDLNRLQVDQPLVVWFGHSSYLVHYRGVNVLVDPVFSGSASPVAGMVTAFPGSNSYTAAQMPPIDYLVLTHNHYDHLDKSTVKALAPKIKTYVMPLGVDSQLNAWLGKSLPVKVLDWWDVIELQPGIRITSTPARHFSGRGLKRGGTLWTSYLLEFFDYTIFLGGDSGYDSHFSAIGKAAGKIDLAILECGQYHPAWAYIHMQPEEVIHAHLDLGAELLLPVHWGKFALSMHSWKDPIQRVTAAAKNNNVNITTPKIGEPLILNGHYPTEKWWLDIP